MRPIAFVLSLLISVPAKGLKPEFRSDLFRVLRNWWPALTMMGLSILSYLDRQILAVLSPVILADAHLTTEAYSRIISGFSIAYMVSNPLWGSVISKIGVRRGLLIAVSAWTLASSAHSLAGGFLGLLLARIALGGGEAATFPGVMRTVADTLPTADQGKGIALGWSGITIASAIAPILFIPMAQHWGWRTAFFSTAFFGAAWVALWYFTVPPERLTHEPEKARFSWPNPLERRFWLVVTAYAMGSFPLAPLLYLSPLYLRSLGYSQLALSRVLWIPPIGWESGSFFWAWIIDRFAGSRERPFGTVWTLALCMLPLGGITHCGPAAAILLLFLGMFMAGGFTVVALRSGACWYPPELSSMVAGIGAGSWSLVVALLMPILGRLFDQDRFQTAFVVISLVPLIGVIAWTSLSLCMRFSRLQKPIQENL